MTAPRALGQRALNRALLERQSLSRRTSQPAATTIEHLVGMQAQEPLAPYVGLWTRLEGFKTNELADLLTDRAAVRIVVMRGTIHLLTADDGLRLAPLTAPVLTRAVNGTFGRQMKGIDVDAVVASARALYEEAPRTAGQVGKLLQERWPDYPADVLGHVARYHLALVQIPPRGLWGQTQRALLAPLEQWLGRPLEAAASVDNLVRRYLNAFGPATPGDMRSWSGLTGLREVFERLRPGLLTFHDERGRELFDVPGNPLPDPDAPAPVRFLPEFDNVILGHDDRTRVVPEEHRHRNVGLVGRPTLLVDGFVAGWWSVARSEAGATLGVEPFAPLPAPHRDAVNDEGAILLDFVAPGERHDVRIVTAP